MEKFIEKLTVDGRKALLENEVTLEILLEFTEEDIQDVFKSFHDRFQTRKYLCEERDKSDSKSSNMSEPESDEAATNTEKPTTSTKERSASSMYTAGEMLEKKVRRGKPTRAQLYFRALLRDAAVSANVWKRAPTLAEISDSRKSAFFTAFEVEPELLRHKKELWKRLGESLQNRRKYLYDKHEGKRPGKKMVPTQSHGNLVVGDNVYLLSGQKEQVAEGILIQKGVMFSEVVLKKVIHETELPSPVDGQTSLNQNLIKHVIQWKTSRLEVKKSKSSEKLTKSTTKKIETPVVKQADAEPIISLFQKSTKNKNDVNDVPRDHEQNEPGTSTLEVKKSKSSEKLTKSTTKKIETPVVKQADVEPIISLFQKSTKNKNDVNDVPRDHEQNEPGTSTNKSNSQPRGADVSCINIDNSESDSETDSESLLMETPSVGIYEWAKGELFLGLLKGRSIINCEKPVARILMDSSTEPRLKIYLQEGKASSLRVLKLNRLDVQDHPDPNYCVMKTKLPVDGDEIKIHNIEKFLGTLNQKFEKYAHDV